MGLALELMIQKRDTFDGLKIVAVITDSQATVQTMAHLLLGLGQ